MDAAAAGVGRQNVRRGLVARPRRPRRAKVDSGGPTSTLNELRVMIERGEYDSANRLLDRAELDDCLAAEVLRGELLVRSGNHDAHYELVFRLARSYRLSETHLAWLAVQAAELAVLAGNSSLAGRLLRFTWSHTEHDPVLRVRSLVGHTVAGLVGCTDGIVDDGPADGDAQAAVLRQIVDNLNPAVDPEGEGLVRIAHDLEGVGLMEFGGRVRVVASVWMTGRVDSAIGPRDIARCPWVTSAMLQRRLERSTADAFDSWSTAMELRVEHSPHPSLVNETAEIIAWSAQINEQHMANTRLSRAVEQAQAGWRELANVTSNEIRGLLTSLEVVTDLRLGGAGPPPGLELALVHRVAALTTMTQLGASDSPIETDWPIEVGVPAAAVVADVIRSTRPLFEWTNRSLVIANDVAEDVVIDVHPGLLADMLRWLLVSATTGPLREASVGVTAMMAGHRLRIEIMSRTPQAPPPEQERELGLGCSNTAHRAAVAILDSWGGRFWAFYSVAGLDVTIDLPASPSAAG